MYRVLTDVCRIARAQRARGGIGGVCGAHDLAIPGNGVFPFQHHDHTRAGGHKGGQFGEEGTTRVHRVETFRLALGHVNLPHGGDAQAFFLEARDDGTDDVLGGGIGLDDGEGAFDGHGASKRWAAGLSCKRRPVHAGVHYRTEHR